jgi:hypothetical protein
MAKATSSSTAVTKAKVSLPAAVSAQFADEVAALQKRIAAPSGDRIKCNKDKTFSLPNGDSLEELDALIVDFCAASFYYETGYNENNVVPPTCFALGLEPAGLVPSDNSPDKQCEACAGCWANQFKSASNGRGKACGNVRLLAVLPPDADAETPMMILKVSSTGLKSFDSHAATVARTFNAPVRGVITKITFDQNSDFQSLRFAVDRPADKDLIALANNRLAEAKTRLLTEPDVSGANEAEAPKKVARKSLSKKPVRKAA